MKNEIVTTFLLDKDLIEWYDNTFPGLSRKWFVNRVLLRFKERFNNDHYPQVVDKVVDEVYDKLKGGG